MIPQRIKLSGFLCYKEEQTIDFQGSATLWMLSGLNGSGKSAIFDAVTYALFGHHRGGASGNVELINKESKQMSVEFDFLLNGHLCRIKRTQKRDNKGGTKGTQQIFHLVDGDFQALPDTTNKRDFDAWISENIGLNYDTFTSSVLLLQGKAEKLLDSRPEGRREVLASIVHLERYERLHARADERRKTLEAEVKTLNGRLAAIAEVDPLELGRVRMLIDQCQEQRTLARGEVERLQNLRNQAVLWRDLHARLHQTRQRHQHALQILGEAATIEKSVERLRELRKVCPLMQQISIHRTQWGQANQEINKLTQQREQRRIALGERDAALRRAEENRRVQQARMHQLQSQLTECMARLTQLAGQMQTLQIVEGFERDLKETEQRLAALPTDAEARLTQTRARVGHLDEQARVIPHLERFVRQREALLANQKHIDMCNDEMKSLYQHGNEVASKVAQAKARLEAAEAEKARATERDTEARTHYRQAKSDLDELSKIDGARICRQCGQALTPEHLEEEKIRRGKRVSEAETIGRRCKAELLQANEVWEQARAEYERLTQEQTLARDAYRSQRDALQHAERERTRLRDECASLYHDLPANVAGRISKKPVDDWTQTVWPTTDDLDTLRSEVRALEKARRELERAEQLLRDRETLQHDRDRTLSRLEPYRAALPTDRVALRSEHARVQSEEHAFHTQVDAARVAIDAAEREFAKVQRERETAQAELHRTDGDLRNEELRRDNARREIDRLSKELPESWYPMAESSGLASLSQWQGELRALENEGTEERGRELDYFRANAETIRQEVIDLERQERNYPEEVRQPESELSAQLREAQGEQDRIEAELGRAQRELALLEDRHQQRQVIHTELKALEGQLKTARTLAELLGRERLQLFLVRQAERQVVEYANAVLDRLSGGQLYLQLSGEAGGEGTSSKALALEAFNRATGEQPINVAFLSGSQKFRVAVSLALAIGQYASVQQRPIESVIIDEGFGCLDNHGRQVMIQELQNLRSQMKCILLVSHQEDFAEAFTDGYQFRLENRATRVSRFQR